MWWTDLRDITTLLFVSVHGEVGGWVVNRWQRFPPPPGWSAGFYERLTLCVVFSFSSLLCGGRREIVSATHVNQAWEREMGSLFPWIILGSERMAVIRTLDRAVRT